jgi:putative transposase
MFVERIQQVHPEVSERRACRALSQPRSTQRHAPRVQDDEEALKTDVITLATRFGRYGYRRITALLKELGWQVNHKRVECIWRREGLKVPMKQPKRGRLWLDDSSLIRLRPEHVNHVWAYDFVACRTYSGKPIRLLMVIDEWRKTYNQIRPHSSLGYRPPALAATPVPGKIHPDAWLRPRNLRLVLT